MSQCNIILSEKPNRFYTGAKQSNLHKPIQKHNNAKYSMLNYTAKADDWNLFMTLNVNVYAHATRIGKRLNL